jgi:hypothetical protein
MALDTSLMRYFSKEKKCGVSGYITPPLTAPRRRNGGLAKRVAMTVLMALMLLYLFGFSVPGCGRGNKKVVIILAANLGGGITRAGFADNRCVECQKWRRLGVGEVKYS